MNGIYIYIYIKLMIVWKKSQLLVGQRWPLLLARLTIKSPVTKCDVEIIVWAKLTPKQMVLQLVRATSALSLCSAPNYSIFCVLLLLAKLHWHHVIPCITYCSTLYSLFTPFKSIKIRINESWNFCTARPDIFVLRWPHDHLSVIAATNVDPILCYASFQR